MPILIALITAAAGVLNTLQAGANASLNKALGQPILAALVVAGTNALVDLLAAPFLGLSWPSGTRWASVPWWAWLGGAMGAAYVLAMVIQAERLGAALFTGITVTAAIMTYVVPIITAGWASPSTAPVPGGSSAAS